MIRRVLMTCIISGFFVAVFPLAAQASCTWHAETHFQDGAENIEMVQVCSGDPGATVASDTDDEIRDSQLDAVCVVHAIELGADPFDYCDIPSDGIPPDVTPGMVAAALARIPLPAAALKVQPANGRTLVNFDTNFYTELQPLDRTITLLGQQVALHIVPSQFGWRFGDGGSLTTDRPGAPYPHLDVTHSYLAKGRVAPSVDTTYTAQFSVGGGPWQEVPGSVTIAGAPVDLDVLTATPTLVGY
jgi:hypothetical protein